jgi:hypothetical protein
MNKGGTSKGMGSSLGGGFRKAFKKSEGAGPAPMASKPSKQAQMHTKPSYSPGKPKIENRDGGEKQINRSSGAFDDRTVEQNATVESGVQPRRRGCCLLGCALPVTGIAALAAILLSMAI